MALSKTITLAPGVTVTNANLRINPEAGGGTKRTYQVNAYLNKAARLRSGDSFRSVASSGLGPLFTNQHNGDFF